MTPPSEIILGAGADSQNITLDASGYGLGSVTFQIQGQDVTAIGSTSDDLFVLSPNGSGTLDGGGFDDEGNLLQLEADQNMVLGEDTLAVSGQVLYSFSNMQTALLIGGASDNTLDASDFAGSVRLEGVAGNNTLRASQDDSLLVGGSGNDELIGGAGNDVLTGGRGNNTLDGGDGTNQVFGQTAHRLTLSDSNLVRGDQEEIVRLTWSGSQDEQVRFFYGEGDAFDNVALAADAEVLEVQYALEQLDGIGQGNVQVDRELSEQGNVSWVVRFIGDFMAADAEGNASKELFTLGAAAASQSALSVQAQREQARRFGVDNLTNIQGGLLQAVQAGDVRLDASDFTGEVYFEGSGGNDIFIGSQGDNTFNALAGDNRIIAGQGVNTVTGGTGTDHLILNLSSDTSEVDLKGSEFSITASDATVTSSFQNIERVSINSADDGGALSIDASEYHGASLSTRLVDLVSEAALDTLIAEEEKGGSINDEGQLISPLRLGVQVGNGGQQAISFSGARQLEDVVNQLNNLDDVDATFDASSGRISVTAIDDLTLNALGNADQQAALNGLFYALGMPLSNASGDTWQSERLVASGVSVVMVADAALTATGSQGNDRFQVNHAHAHTIDGHGGENTLTAFYAGDMQLSDTLLTYDFNNVETDEDDKITDDQRITADIANVHNVTLTVIGDPTGADIDAADFNGHLVHMVTHVGGSLMAAQSDDTHTRVDVTTDGLDTDAVSITTTPERKTIKYVRSLATLMRPRLVD
ncbi:hypothetical protein HLB35_15625 [Halomonas sp. TBZ9]|uniref:Uncharacterized protein n=1 Tax=Vreelandella azerica TaxID=2732867 RepID=A0A7Y3TZ13_9GAMM|nr:calcium-binding protein [Halomonas azerica]NOG32828.1 hypothetical protein [Halomonas azerica]